MDVGISSYDGYIPKLRLSRAAIADANSWLNPALRAQSEGTRAMASWDEDSLTMAVEAGRRVIQGPGADIIEGFYLASTTLPYEDRLNAGIAAGAISLKAEIQAFDIGGSQRAGTSALLNALAATQAGMQKSALVVASEKRRAPAGSPQEMQYGDAAAACVVSAEDVVARFIGSHTSNVDFVDHFRGRGADFDYYWEDRWIRDEGWKKIVPKTIEEALSRNGIQADKVSRFIMPCPFRGLAEKTAKRMGFVRAIVQESLNAHIGDAGVAQPLLMLNLALEQAEPGDILMLVSFGQGCDVLFFEATDALVRTRPAIGVQAELDAGSEETNYMKYLVFNDLVAYHKGMRAEFDRKASLSAVYRQGALLSDLTGGICTKCETPQLPSARLCVSCGSIDSQQPYRFSHRQGTILSWSADYLTHSIDPPNHYGMIEFEGGGRLMMDITDIDPGEAKNDLRVGMVYRVKDIDAQRGYRRYFWKARPLTHSTEGSV